MKTSEALRLADEMGLPDRHGVYVEGAVRNWGGEKPPCCAVGGAAIAAGLRITPEKGVVPAWQISAATRPNTSDWAALPNAVACPVEGCYRNEKWCGDTGIISHLYERHRWSRTRIADWLDTLEVTA